MPREQSYHLSLIDSPFGVLEAIQVVRMVFRKRIQCYHFACELSKMIEGEMFYNMEHVIFKHKLKYYDWTGEYKGEHGDVSRYEPLKDYTKSQIKRLHLGRFTYL